MTTITEIVKQAKRDFDDRRAVKEQTFDDFVRWKDSICNKIDKLRQLPHRVS